MLVSLAFSVAIYRFASIEVARGVDRQIISVQRLPFLTQEDLRDIRDERDQLIEEGNAALVQKLIWFNLNVALVGGLAAYLLARRTLEPIEEAHQHEQRFVADASHELRTPLTVLRSELEVALRESKATKASHEAVLKSSLEEVVRLERLTSRLLTLSKRSTKVSAPDITEVSVTETCSQAVRRLGLKPERVLVEAGVVRSEPALLLEVITILIENAVKYGNDVPVQVRSKQEGSKVVLEVENQGESPTQEVLSQVFDRFYRAETSRTSEGSGLGLSIARSLVDSLGGTISLQSTKTGVLARIVLPQ